MLAPEKDRLAAQVMERWAEFQETLSSQKRSYPTGKFEVFWNAAKRYAELTRSDPPIHRAVAAAVNGLVDFLEVERSGRTSVRRAAGVPASGMGSCPRRIHGTRTCSSRCLRRPASVPQ
jgi:hypothetical protein